MKDGKPETLAEALRLIEEQNRRLSEKENQLKQKDKELEEANNEILKQNEEILKQIAEIKILNEKLAHRRAMEFVARSEKAARLLKDQPLLFDSEDLSIQIDNPCPVPSDEDITQTETEEKSSEEKKIKKSNKGRKGASTTNNLAKAKIVIDLTDEEKICPNCGSQMKSIRQI